jgi:hypothetical protein
MRRSLARSIKGLFASLGTSAQGGSPQKRKSIFNL